MKRTAFTLLFVLAVPAFGDWTPPENPNPQAILNEARADKEAKRYQDALAKHVWFHQHALKYAPAMYGVRLSFALMNWDNLAKEYPPALAKLKEVRDDARQAVRDAAKPQDAKGPFHDYAALNRTLGDSSKTAALFAELDKQSPATAKLVYGQALPSLIEAKQYRVCDKYLEPKSDLAAGVRWFQENQRLAKDPKFGANLQQFAEKKFTNDTATLVALLVLNDRGPEAKETAAEARKEWANADFSAALDQALKGVVPKPWP